MAQDLIWNTHTPIKLIHKSKIIFKNAHSQSYLLIVFQNFIENCLNELTTEVRTPSPGDNTTSNSNYLLPYFVDQNDNANLIKWHLPISVLSDLHRNNRNSKTPKSDFFEIELKFTTVDNWPSNLLPLDQNWIECNRTTSFMYVKMADQIRNKGDLINVMTKQEKDSRWEAVMTSNLVNFNKENDKFLKSCDKKVPIFLHYKTTSILIFYPENSKLNTLLDNLPEGLLDSSESVAKILVQGVEIPLEDRNLDLKYLFEHCLCVDNILHFCLF